MEILVQYSGGKDSQAALIWSVEKYGSKNIKAVFCDTGWEHESTYKHITDTCGSLCVELVIVKSKKYEGMVGLAKKKGRFPSTKARFCTQELKTIPFIDYVLDECNDVFVIQGIRGDESYSRSKMKAQCTVFKYYTQPYQTNTMIVEHLSVLEDLSLTQRKKLAKAKDRISKGKDDPKYHTYRKKEVLTHISKYASDIMRPHFAESSTYVITYIIENGQVPNPLYYKGSKRVGCYPCIMSGHNEVLQIIKRDPDRIEEIKAYETEIGSSFFKIDYVPKKYQTGICERSGKKFTRCEDIIKYLTLKNATCDMFEDEAISCSSYYHLCE